MADMLSRLRGMIPRSWRGDDTPVLDAILAAAGVVLQRMADLLTWVRRQGRLRTAEGAQLDQIATDFLGAAVQREEGEDDESLRTRLRIELLRPKATRRAVIQAIEDVTGETPVVVEPARPADIGGYGVARGYGVGGRYGSLRLPYQAFITSYRPIAPGVPSVNGWTGTIAGWGRGLGMWLSGRDVAERIPDRRVMRVIARTMPAAGVAWVQFTSRVPEEGSGFVLDQDRLDVNRL
ncbi:MAG: hypothetical protein DI601_00270 [Azospirillum brasilense]|nr:MAG: hypothetical protein DI601_00270 [Azospirillum brasilense]